MASPSTPATPKTPKVPEINIKDYGWDLTYISSITNANKSIKALGTSPNAFTIAPRIWGAGRAASDPGHKLGITGHFGPWELFLGSKTQSKKPGAANEAWFKIPILSGTLNEYEPTGTDIKTSWDISGGSIVAQCNMSLYEASAARYNNIVANGGTYQTLEQAAPKKGQNDPWINPNTLAPYWQVVVGFSNWTALAPLSQNVSAAEHAAMCGDAGKEGSKGWIDDMFEMWLTDPTNQAEIKQVFAEFNLGAELAKDGAVDGNGKTPLYWMMPSVIDYCVIENFKADGTPDPDTSFLGCVAMGANRPRGNNAPLVDQRALELVPKSNSGLVIGPEMVLKNFLKPSLQATAKDGFDKTKATEWDIDANSLTVKNRSDIKLCKLPNNKWDKNKKADEQSADAYSTATVGAGMYQLKLGEKSIGLTITDATYKWDDQHTVRLTYKTSYTIGLDKDKKNIVVTPGADNLTPHVDSDFKSSVGTKILEDVCMGFVGGLAGGTFAIAAEKIAATTAWTNFVAGFVDTTGITSGSFRYTAQQMTTDTGAVIAGGNVITRVQIDGFAQTMAKYAADGVLSCVEWADKRFDSIATAFGTTKGKVIGGIVGAFTALGVKTAVENAKLSKAAIEKDVKGELTAFTPTVKVGMSCVKWPAAKQGEEGFAMNEIYLDGSLIIGGELIMGAGGASR